jgi:hypothetical protein
MLPTFPAQVMATWNATMALQSFELDGALPVLVTPCN